MVKEKYKLLPKVKSFLEGTKPLFIGGDWVSSLSGKTFKTLNPATGKELGVLCEGRSEDINAAVESARVALDEGPWSVMSASERSKLLYKLAELMEDNKYELAQIDTLDNGKPIAELLDYDIPNAIEHFRYYAGWTTKIVGQTVPVQGSYFNYTKHEPVGIVGQIIPWNFPLMMAAWKLAPALATGCTVILKPAEQTPLSSLYLAQLIQEAGFPDGVVNIVPGFGEEAGKSLVSHPNVNKIAFTGSTKVGKSIMKEAANTMKRVTLELGGKSPNIILPDANLDIAIPGVFNGIMVNQGEVCTAGSRVFIPRENYDNIVSKLIKYAENLKLGNGLDNQVDMGPLISIEQQEKVHNYIKIGEEEGAKIVTGGIENNFEKGYFVNPTIFTNVNDNMTIAREEIFGPVLSAIPYNSINEVIQRANNSNYGLAAGLWTNDVKQAHYVAGKLKAGTVWINCYNITDASTPFGGYKQSGLGREMGSYALNNYTEVKSVWVSLE